MSQATTKVCRFCQMEVSGKPRIKDRKGRYAWGLFALYSAAVVISARVVACKQDGVGKILLVRFGP